MCYVPPQQLLQLQQMGKPQQQEQERSRGESFGPVHVLSVDPLMIQVSHIYAVPPDLTLVCSVHLTTCTLHVRP